MQRKRFAGLILILLSVFVVLVSAFVYQQAQQTTSQTIAEVASLTLNNAALGNIEEGETILYTAGNTSAVNNILSVTTTKGNVYLHFDTDLDAQSGNYNTYQIEVIVDTVPGGSGVSGTVATLTIANPDTSSGINLDITGTYIFDFQVTTSAQSVSGNQATTVNITVTAEST
jgi:hypothetical protein